MWPLLVDLYVSQEHIDATEARHSNFASSPKIVRLDEPLRSKIEYDRPGMSNGLERHSAFCYLAVSWQRMALLCTSSGHVFISSSIRALCSSLLSEVRLAPGQSKQQSFFMPSTERRLG